MSYVVSKDWSGRFVYNTLRQSTLGKSTGLRWLCLLLNSTEKMDCTGAGIVVTRFPEGLGSNAPEN